MPFQREHKGYWLGKKRPPFSEEWKKKIGIGHKGIKFSDERKSKISQAKIGKKRPDITGENSSQWKGGRKSERYKSLARERSRLWKVNNPKRVAAQVYLRRAKKRQTEVPMLESEWQNILLKYNGECLDCGSKEKITCDHIIPISKGGQHTINNVQPLCLKCNMKKHIKIIDFRLKYVPQNSLGGDIIDEDDN